MKPSKAIPLTLGGLAFLALVFVLLGTAGVATWEYTNSNAFCTQACHAVHPEETFAHLASQHANVHCVECHVGRMSTFRAAVEKSGHITHAWGMIIGYERPLTAPSMPASRDSCEGCHTSNPHLHNSIRVRRHFAPDEGNTETKVTLIARAVGRTFQGGGTPGVNWHIHNTVRFVATDLQRTNILWVEATRTDGTVVRYEDSAGTGTVDSPTSANIRTMECVDCHNLAGHPIRAPDALVDEALAAGILNPALPEIKARAVKLLEQKFENAAEAKQLVLEAWDQYAKDFPDEKSEDPEAWEQARKYLEERQNQVAGLMLRNQFLAADVSWRSFPDQLGHKDSPGCFRCHNGRYSSTDGQLITAQCTACHSIPMVTRRDRIHGQVLDLTDMRSPRSHQRPDFPFVHGGLAATDDAGCENCHGEIQYGTDDATFCANSGCHDSKWPNFGLQRPTALVIGEP
jgi:hypothetical protein